MGSLFALASGIFTSGPSRSQMKKFITPKKKK